MEEGWKREWRRRAGGVMGVAVLVGGGYVSASQSFVSVGKNGTLVHPSPFGWLLLVCLLLGLGALYSYAVTYWEWLLPRRLRPVDHSTMYGLALAGCAGNADLSNVNGQMIVQVGVVFVNSAKSVISYRVEDLTAKIDDIEVDSSAFPTTGGRLLPGHARSYMSPHLGVPIAERIAAEVSYEVTYGPIGGFPRYRRTHKITIILSDIALPDRRGSNNWLELEEETDVIISPALHPPRHRRRHQHQVTL